MSKVGPNEYRILQHFRMSHWEGVVTCNQNELREAFADLPHGYQKYRAAAASLMRKGILERYWNALLSKALYWLTPEGRMAAQEPEIADQYKDVVKDVLGVKK